MVILYGVFGTTYRHHLRESKSWPLKINTSRCEIYQKSAGLFYFAVEAWNHVKKKIACIHISNKTHLVSVAGYCYAAAKLKFQLCYHFQFTCVCVYRHTAEHKSCFNHITSTSHLQHCKLWQLYANMGLKSWLRICSDKLLVFKCKVQSCCLNYEILLSIQVGPEYSVWMWRRCEDISSVESTPQSKKKNTYQSCGVL